MTEQPVLLVAGYLTVDIGCRVPRLPDWDGRVTAQWMERTQGGMAANCASAAARLGTRTRFFGHTDSGPLGEEALAALHAFGVETDAVVRTDGGSSLCVILVDGAGRRMIISEPLDFDWRPLDGALAHWDGGAGALYVDGYRLTEALERAARVHETGLSLCVDLDGLDAVSEQTLADAARMFDVIFLNRDVAEAAGVDADQLVELGATVVSVTLGAEGAIVAVAGERRHVEPLAVDVVDTTGAGDVFAGAFLHHWLQSGSAFDAAVFANAAAAVSTTARGARGVLPDRRQVMAVLSEAEPGVSERRSQA